MLLTYDVGNTNITIGVFGFKKGMPSRTPLHIWRLETDASRSVNAYAAALKGLLKKAHIAPRSIKAVAVASVVPPVNKVLKEVNRTLFDVTAVFIEGYTQRSMRIRYKKPKEVGADRIANAVAARELYGVPSMVIDFGTATTFDCINARGEYLGGVIVPGPKLAAAALFEKTARLPRVEIIKPRTVIGISTTSSIQSGLYYGYRGLIKEILQQLAEDMGAKSSVRVYIEFSCDKELWSTVGVHTNILRASIEAIEKGFRYYLKTIK